MPTPTDEPPTAPQPTPEPGPPLEEKRAAGAAHGDIAASHNKLAAPRSPFKAGVSALLTACIDRPRAFARREPLLAALIVVAAACALAPIWIGRYLPLLDYPNHLSMVFVWFHLDDPAWNFAPYYTINLPPLPYWAHYGIVYALSYVFGTEIAQKVFLSVTVLLYPVALAVYAKRMGRDPRLGALAFPLAWSYSTANGFLSYIAGIPVMLLALAALDKHAQKPSWRWGVTAALLGTLLYFFHVLPWALFLLAGGLCAIMTPRPWTPLHALAAPLPTVPAALLGVLAYRAARTTQTPFNPWNPQGLSGFAGAYNDLFTNLSNLPGWLINFHPGYRDEIALLVLVLAWLMLLALPAAKTERSIGFAGADATLPETERSIGFAGAGASPAETERSIGFAGARALPPETERSISSSGVGSSEASSLDADASQGARSWRVEVTLLVVLITFLSLPRSLMRPFYWYAVNGRLAIILALLALVLVRGRITGARRFFFAVAMLAGIGYTADLAAHFKRFNERAHGFDVVMAEVPPGKQVLPIMLQLSDPDISVNAYNQWGSYIQLRQGGFMQFNFVSEFPVKYRRRLASPPWDHQEQFNFQWHARDWDYFVVRGRGPGTVDPFANVHEKVKLVTRSGDWELWQKLAN